MYRDPCNYFLKVVAPINYVSKIPHFLKGECTNVDCVSNKFI